MQIGHSGGVALPEDAAGSSERMDDNPATSPSPASGSPAPGSPASSYRVVVDSGQLVVGFALTAFALLLVHS